MPTMQARLDAIEHDLLPAEYQTAKKLAAEAQRMMVDPPPFTNSPDQWDPFATGEIREEWVNMLIDQKDYQDKLGRRRGVLLDLLKQARGQAEIAANSICNDVLRAYHGELMQLLDAVADIADELGDVRTADEAIAQDLGEPWKRLSQLADDYATLRSAQLHRTDPDLIHRSNAVGMGAEQHASDLFIRNLDELWPEWRMGGAANGRSITNLDGTQPRYEPWPAIQPQLLLWLATSQAEAWIPTPDQLQQHWADRRNRANPMPTATEIPKPKRANPDQNSRQRIVKVIEPAQ